MDSKSASKKLPAVAEQGAVIKFSMPAGPESDEFYSNLVRKFGPDVVSRTVKENCAPMSPRSKTPNYLLSSDKDGPQEADVDKLIQNYVKLNPQLREQLVAMLKSLAEGKEIRIEPSTDATGQSRRTVRVKTDDPSTTSPAKTALSPKSLASSRSPRKLSSNASNLTSKASPVAAEGPALERVKSHSSDAKEGTVLSSSNRTTELESPKSPTKLKASSLSTTFGQDFLARGSAKPSEPPAPPSSPRSGQAQSQVGSLRVVGATAKALELLRADNLCIDDIAVLNTTPKRIDDSDCDEVFKFAGCTQEELARLESAGAASKKKKKRNKKKNKKKNSPLSDDVCAIDNLVLKLGAEDPCAQSSTEDLSTADAIPSKSDARASTLETFEVGYLDAEGAAGLGINGHPIYPLREETPDYEDSDLGAADPYHDESPSTSSGHVSAVLAMTEPLRLVKDIESRAPIGLTRSDMLLEKEFKFQSVSHAECSVVTSWDDLKELVAEVFPNDSELQEAFATKAHNSLDLWKFIVKYGRMYKDFVSEVLEMVNELKKGLIDAMDMHREKTNEILETHKKEMCSVVEKAKAADHRIEMLEKELDEHRISADDQKVRAFTQEEEIQKLQKDLTARDKKLREFDNVKKDLLTERNRVRSDRDRIASEHDKTKAELLKFKSECDSLRTRLKRSREGAEETDYRCRELESKLCDEQAETEKLRESNAKLTKKTEALQLEIERLKEKQARQKQIETANKSSLASLMNTAAVATDNSRVSAPRSISSTSTSPSRGSFFSSIVAPLSSRTPNSQYHSPLNSSSYLPNTARAVGSPSSKMFHQNTNQAATMRQSPLSSVDSSAPQVSRTSYAAASAPNLKDAFGQNFSYRDSALGKQPKEEDPEVHSLLTPSESPTKYRNDFSSSNVGNGDGVMYDDATTRVLRSLRNSKTESPVGSVSSSLPSFASLFSKDDSTARQDVPYSPWGNPNYEFPSPAAPLLFNIKPSSLTVGATGYQMDQSSRFPDSGLCSSSEISQKAVDQNSPKPDQGFRDLFRS